MTPAARVQAAIEILDTITAGGAAERVLTAWARANRFAGSGDRAAIRDHVFSALRCRRSFGWLGGAAEAEATGRQLMLGALRDAGIDPATLFTGAGYGPAPLTGDEIDIAPADMPENIALDCPDWLAPQLKSGLGADFAPVMRALRQRAPVFLRVNTGRTSLGAAQDELGVAGMVTRTHPLAATALEVIENPQKLRNAPAYLEGRVELQDAASQAVVAEIPLRPVLRVLDYCAGGGGKTLALGARLSGAVFVHDTAPDRMRELSNRAARAGLDVTILETNRVAAYAPYDLVLLDVPCSGSGAWRRSPEAKWTLTTERLAELTHVQAEILDETAGYVAPEGRLVYLTCSLLQAENGDQIDAFLARTPGWRLAHERRLTPLDGGDGFYAAHLTRASW
jgi:16S rRNA (cytosine967-C5)-methyltransferase